MTIRKSSISGIPFGKNAGRPANPQPGQPYFNGESNRLEIYTETVGWQNIVQETPAVVSVVGALNQNASSTLTINGTNFAVGAIAYAVGSNGVETAATSTSLISVVQLTSTFPPLSPDYEPYDIKVVNPSNLYGILYDAITVDNVPTWNTASGSLGTYIEQSSMSVSVSATDPVDPLSSPLIYSISSGSLPSGLSINSATGAISGTPADVVPNTTYNFTVSAYDGRNPAITRNFSITISDRGPSWSTSATLPSFTKNSAYSTTVVATDDNGIASYSLFSGSLPTGLTLNGTTGVISGTPSSSSPESFTLRATDSGGNYADRQFTITNVGPTWITASGTVTIASGSTSQLSATDDSGVAPTYTLVTGTLPSGTSLSSSGLITAGSTAGSTSVTVRATDANGTYVDRAFTISVVLYQFTSHSFTNASQVGPYGPTLAQLQSAYSSQSWASNTNYLNIGTQGIQLWQVPQTGTYRFEIAGASSVRQSYNGAASTMYGRAAKFTMTRNLNGGDVLKIGVGQLPANTSGWVTSYSGEGNTAGSCFNGGGGGTFVAFNNNTLIAAAGGGGSHRTGYTGSQSAMDANLDFSATAKSGEHGAGGSSGAGGADNSASDDGTAGAGFSGDGSIAGYTSNYITAKAFINGANGCIASNFSGSPQPSGGFGGGGAGGWGGSGGGGGYSGGGAGGNSIGYGGGGANFVDASSTVTVNPTQASGAGYVTITKI